MICCPNLTVFLVVKMQGGKVSFPGLEKRADRPEVRARHISAVRNFGSWIDPLDVSLSNAFKQRAIPADQEEPDAEIPHSFTMVPGRQLSQRHRSLMNEAVKPDGIYCCVKMYVRDVNLSQPPLLVILPSKGNAVVGASPSQVLAAAPLSVKQIQMYSRLQELCEHKYELRAAGLALRQLIHDRRYQVYHLPWLSLPSRHVQVTQPEGHLYFPYLPKACWQLVAKIH